MVQFDPQQVGRRLAAARQQRGWTQLRFALEANVSPSSVSRWERGLLPPVRELMRLAEVLGIDMGELVEPAPSQLVAVEHEIVERLDRIERLLLDLCRSAA